MKNHCINAARKSLKLTKYFIVLCALLLISTPFLEAVEAQEAVPGEFILKFKEKQPPSTRSNVYHQLGVELIRENALTGTKFVRTPRGKSINDKFLKDLLSSGKIDYIEPNYVIQIDALPNDSEFASLWGLNNPSNPNIDIDAPEGWDLETGGEEIVIGVIDTGIDYRHPDLAANIWTNPNEIPGNGIDDDQNGVVDDIHGYNAFTQGGDPMDDHNHGTHVAGTIAAVGNNRIGIVGVNWRAKLMGLKFLNASGSGTTQGAIDVLQYAVQMKQAGVNLKVLNNSWGGGGFSQALFNAFSAAEQAGILSVAAAGNAANDNDYLPTYPANYGVETLISVAALDRQGQLATFSNYGADTVDLAAPGVDIFSTVRNGAFREYSGTSMASPHVAGVAAALWAREHLLSVQQVAQRLRTTIRPLDTLTDRLISPGIVNLNNALRNIVTTVPRRGPRLRYQKSTIAFSPETNYGTRIREADDGYVTVALPFTFPFYGRPHNRLAISSNGRAVPIRDGESPDLRSDYNNRRVAGISPYNDDLFPFAVSPQRGVWFSSNPNSAVVTWVASHYGDRNRGDLAHEIRVQLKIDVEGNIEFHYIDTDANNDTFSFGASATVGVIPKLRRNEALIVSENEANPSELGSGRALRLRPATVRGITDIDGDGLSDLAHWNASQLRWIIKTSSTDFTQTLSYQLGLAGDKPIIGEFDGDGISDLAIWRPSNGTWYFRKSTEQYENISSIQWGLKGDDPIPGDFDGDGKTDLGIYRRSAALYIILLSSSGYNREGALLGVPGTVYSHSIGGLAFDAIPGADLDGDKRDEFSVIWQVARIWDIRNAETGEALPPAPWGNPGDTPITCDWNGNGTEDRIMVRVNEHNLLDWYAALDGGGADVETFASLGDIPSCKNDFDGDALVDLAVFRPSTGQWFIRYSSDELRRVYSFDTLNNQDCPSGQAKQNDLCTPVHSISGQVILEESGLGVENIVVNISSGAGSVITNPNGTYLFSNLFDGNYQLSISAPGYVVEERFQNPVNLSGGDVANRIFVLSCAPGYVNEDNQCVPSYNLGGVVRLEDSSTPLAGAEISIESHGNALSNVDGEYSFSGIPSGSYILSISLPPGYELASAPRLPVVIFSADRTDLNFDVRCKTGYLEHEEQCQKTYSLIGTAKHENGGAITGLEFSLGGSKSALSDADGKIRFSGLLDGNYQLSLSVPKQFVLKTRPDNPIAISGADRDDLEFVLECAKGHLFRSGNCLPVFAISGVVRFANSNTPVTDAIVEVGGSTGIKTDSLGRYEITGLIDGRYSLRAIKAGLVITEGFQNPIEIRGANVANSNFVANCPPGLVLENTSCVLPPQDLALTASDGDYLEHVLVQWNKSSSAETCNLYRTDPDSELEELIASELSSNQFADTSATAKEIYAYRASCSDGSATLTDKGWRDASSAVCIDGTECINEQLPAEACAGANAFLNQVNIATVINRQSTPLNIEVSYRDLSGVSKGSIETTIEPQQKVDFIVNDLGLERDSYGTVCVRASTSERDAWSGGVSIYKPSGDSTESTFGSAFDYVLYQPFSEPRSGDYVLPINTSRLGVRPDSTIANWISISDAIAGDGQGLSGTIEYIGPDGRIVSTSDVSLEDGARFDFAGHLGLAGPENKSIVGMARFRVNPNEDGTAVKYYISLGRYFYNCPGASCNNFYSAFIMPHRPATDATLYGSISTVDGEISVIELNNFQTDSTLVEIAAYDESGTSTVKKEMEISALATRHEIVNRVSDNGFLADNRIGAAELKILSGKLSATSLFYKLNENGVLQYVYPAPLTGKGEIVQVSEWNSFINLLNTGELFNSTENEQSVQILARGANNKVLFTLDEILSAHSSKRIEFNLPKDDYGSFILQTDSPGIVFRNYVSRGNEYRLAFPGK